MPSFHDFGSIGKNPRRLERLEQGLKIIGDLRKLLSKKEKVWLMGQQGNHVLRLGDTEGA